jgi:hypothetical protein
MAGRGWKRGPLPKNRGKSAGAGVAIGQFSYIFFDMRQGVVSAISSCHPFFHGVLFFIPDIFSPPVRAGVV